MRSAEIAPLRFGLDLRRLHPTTAAGMNMDMLGGHFLMTLATVAVEHLQQGRPGSEELIGLAQVPATALEGHPGIDAVDLATQAVAPFAAALIWQSGGY